MPNSLCWSVIPAKSFSSPFKNGSKYVPWLAYQTTLCTLWSHKGSSHNTNSLVVLQMAESLFHPFFAPVCAASLPSSSQTMLTLNLRNNTHALFHYQPLTRNALPPKLQDVRPQKPRRKKLTKQQPQPLLSDNNLKKDNTGKKKKKLAQDSLYILYPGLWQAAQTGALPSPQ